MQALSFTLFGKKGVAAMITAADLSTGDRYAITRPAMITAADNRQETATRLRSPR
ncbi:MAG TPA: hypothetical protein VLE20_02435 [Blastocatellia bacterium]|nr:hypothetical protein [Blastocatellia bacterium]